ncbi:hypothetical protein ABM005_16880 [Morganella morganii]|uniref:hypothetical protein n=1 Tax=Morganella morganii TaxID=582 RepID=UPI003EC11949
MFVSHELSEMKQKIMALENEMKLNIAASNFIFYHIIETINTKYPDSDFIESLKKNIENDIQKITNPTHNLKKAINTLLQDPVRQMCKPKDEPFIK